MVSDDGLPSDVSAEPSDGTDAKLRGAEWLLPATRVHIRRIDLAAGRIELDPTADLSGLLAGGQPEEKDAASV